jgi:prepilin-type N-terminal cleavage/methylation domain-containing protein
MALINKKQSNLSFQAGVTLIELIVVVAIFSLVSSILLFNYSDFSTNVSIRNLSQEIALTVRKVQTYATSVRGIDNSNVSTRSFPAYGISFSVDPSSGTFEPNKKQFILFADIPQSVGSLPNKRYDGDGSCGNPVSGGECLENFSIDSSDTIVELCPDGACVSAGSVDITFRRPIPDAIICYKTTSSGDCQNSSISYVDIIVQSVKGIRRTISVWNTGQISVK